MNHLRHHRLSAHSTLFISMGTATQGQAGRPREVGSLGAARVASQHVDCCRGAAWRQVHNKCMARAVPSAR
eukprot:51354-Pyramimonas_sp.AAC.1